MSNPKNLPSADPRNVIRLIDQQRPRNQVSAPQVLKTRSGNDIKMMPVVWAWFRRWIAGELNLLDGPPEMLKTTIALYIAAQLSRGESLPFDDRAITPRTSILFSPEEAVELSGLPKFVAAGGDRGRFLEIMRDRKSSAPQMVFPSGAQLLDDTLTKLEADGHNLGLLILDGISVILEDGKDENKNGHVKPALESLLEVTRRHKVTVIGVRHTGKTGHTSVGNWGIGSVGWRGMARSQHVVMRHPDEDGKYVFANAKPAYVAKELATSLVLSVRSVDVQLDDDERTVGSYGCVKFESESKLTAQEWADRLAKKGKQRATKEEIEGAMAFLRSYLADGVMRPYEAVVAAAKANAGIEKNALWTARTALRKAGVVKSERDPTHTGPGEKPWVISMPIAHAMLGEGGGDDVGEEAPF